MKYCEGDHVTFFAGDMIGDGYICGVSHVSNHWFDNDVYIVRLEKSNLDKTVYPFSCLCVASRFITSHTRKPDYANPEG